MNYKKLWYLFLCIPLHSIIQTAQCFRQLTQFEKDYLLIQAIENNETEEAIRLLKLGADPNAIVTYQCFPFYSIKNTVLFSKKITVLSLAAIFGNSSIVRTLLAYGADPRRRTEMLENHLPLHKAARSGSLECVKILLNVAPDTLDALDAKGCSVEASIIGSETPLMYAIKWNHTEVAQFLLEKGANPHLGKRLGLKTTALHLAVERLNLTIVRQLLALDVKQEHDILATPLHAAAWHTPHDEALKSRQKSIMQLLLAHGASLKAQNRLGETPLDYEKNSNCSHFLKKYAAYHPIINKTEENPLFSKVKQAYDTWMLHNQPEMLAAMLGLVPDHPMNTDSYAVAKTRALFNPEIFDTMAVELSTTPTMATFIEDQTRKRLTEEAFSGLDSIKTRMNKELMEQQCSANLGTIDCPIS